MGTIYKRGVVFGSSTYVNGCTVRQSSYSEQYGAVRSAEATGRQSHEHNFGHSHPSSLDPYRQVCEKTAGLA